MRFLRLPRLFLVFALAVVALVPAAVAASPKPAAACTNVSQFVIGTSIPEIDFTLDPPLLVEVLAMSDDVLGGDLIGLQTINKITPGGVIHFTGYNYYTDTDFGDFEAVTKGQVTPDGKLSLTITIVAGDASGKMTGHGSWNGDTGDWDALHKGRVCSS